MSYEASTNNPPPYIQPSEEQLKTKRRRTRSTIVSIFFILIGLTALENYFLQQKTTSSVATNIAVLTVFNIILILLFVLIVLITRHLVKLYNERKSQIIGSKFQTKLIIAFLILALVPSVLLFTVASKLFTYSIGSWFNLQVKQTLQQSMDVAREYYSHVETGALSQTKNIEGFIKREELYRQENRGRLASLIGQKVNEYELGGLIIFDNNYKTVASSFNQKVAPGGIDLDYKDLLQKSVEGEAYSVERNQEHLGLRSTLDDFAEHFCGAFRHFGQSGP